jgi:hypothetical protein
VDRSVAQGRRTSPSDLLPVIAVAVVAFAAARLALLPGVAFWDTGEFQTVGPIMGTAHPTGFPTYVLLGWLASVVLQPFGEPAFRMNLLSAICLAVAAGVTVDLVRALTGSVALGMVAGLGLALTPIAWAIGTHAEAHALHIALVAILVRLLVAWEDRVRGPMANDHADRYLVGAAVVFGLSVGNHSLTLLLAIPVGLYVLTVSPDIWRRPRLILACVAALAITLVVVYLELPLRAGPFRAGLVYGRPDTWDGFWYVVLAEQFRGSLLDPFGDLTGKAAQLGSLAWAQFGLLAPLIPVGFVATVMRRPRYALLTGSALVITCFFAASYINADINRYYLGPILIAWTWLAILAAMVAEAVAAARPSRIALAAALLAAVMLAPTLLAIPGRLHSADESRDHAAAAWLDRVLPLLEPDAVVISWWSYSTPLWYAQQVEGRRPDIFIADDRTRLDQGLGEPRDVIDANLGRRPVYVLRQNPADIDELGRRYELETLTSQEAGLLVRVVGPRAAT